MPVRERRLTILGMHYRPEITGNAPYTSGIAEALSMAGSDVRVVCSHPHYPEWSIHDGYGGWRTNERIEGVDVRRVRHWIPKRPGAIGRFGSEVSFGLRQTFTRWGRPDAILLVSPALFSTAVAMLRARMSRARKIVWVQDVYSSGVKEIGLANGWLACPVQWVESRTLRAADVVVVVHDSFRRTLVEDLGVRPESIRTIRNWSHVGDGLAADRQAIRSRLGWGPDEFVLLHAGNQGMKQGLENLVGAARIADESDLPIRVILMGDGNQREHLQTLGAGLASLTFMPSVDDSTFADTLRAADALVVNERVGVAEMSVPSKLTSYFAAGRPIVAACAPEGGAAIELAASGAGVRVDPGQPMQLIEQILKFRASPNQFEALGANGLRYRAEVLGAEAATSQFGEVLFGVPEETTPRRGSAPVKET